MKAKPPLPPAITLWYAPECSKSRRARELLEAAKAELTLFDYQNSPPSEAELRELLALLKVPAHKIARRGDAAFRELGLEGADETTLLRALSEHPSLIQRPIAVAPERGQAVIARPPEMLFRLMVPELPEGVSAEELVRLAMQGKLAGQIEREPL